MSVQAKAVAMPVVEQNKAEEKKVRVSKGEKDFAACYFYTHLSTHKPRSSKDEYDDFFKVFELSEIVKSNGMNLDFIKKVITASSYKPNNKYNDYCYQATKHLS